MEISKYGETYRVTDTRQTYGISGEFIKALTGEVLINIGTHVLNEPTNIISLLNGTYNAQNDTLQFTFNTKVSKIEEQIDAIKIVLDAIKESLNDEV